MATTEAKPLSGKYTVSIRLLGCSRSFRAGRGTRSKCGSKRRQSAGESDASRWFGFLPSAFPVRPKYPILNRHIKSLTYNSFMSLAAWYLQNSIMSMTSAVWYLQKVDQCARLAGEATELSQRGRHESDRRAWLQILADEIGADMDA